MTPYNNWEVVSACDIMLSMLSRTISNGLDRIKESIHLGSTDVHSLIIMYRGFGLLVADINTLFGLLIFTQECSIYMQMYWH